MGNKTQQESHGDNSPNVNAPGGSVSITYQQRLEKIFGLSAAWQWAIGIGVAVLGIGLTAFFAIRPPGLCDDLRSDVTKEYDLVMTYEEQTDSLDASRQTVNEQLQRSEGTLQRASRYFQAQDNELFISELHASVAKARANVLQDYGEDFFRGGNSGGRSHGEIWNDYLLAEGYPSSPAEAQRKARRLLAIGGSDSLGNSIATSVPASERYVANTLSELDELRDDWAIRRDNVFSAEFQGAPLDGSLLKDYENEHDALVRRAQSVETELNSIQLEQELAAARLSNACRRVEEKSCAEPEEAICASL